MSDTRRRWRDYRTAAGGRPVLAFIAGLSDGDASAVVAAMKDVSTAGLGAARHLRGELWEVKAEGDRQTLSARIEMSLARGSLGSPFGSQSGRFASDLWACGDLVPAL